MQEGLDFSAKFATIEIGTEFFKKLGVGAMAAVMAVSPVTGMTVFAATSNTDTNNTATANDLEDNDIIDRSKTGSLTILSPALPGSVPIPPVHRSSRPTAGRPGQKQPFLKTSAPMRSYRSVPSSVSFSSRFRFGKRTLKDAPLIKSSGFPR